MISANLINGLKSYFKERNLSDRTLRIVEIDECSFSNCPALKRRSSSDYDVPVTKKQKLSPLGSYEQDETASISNNSSEVNQGEDKMQDNTTVLDATQVATFHKTEVGRDCFYLEMPIHSIVLCLNSSYFKKLLLESGMKETNEDLVSVKVNKGEGKYLEILIESFYNEDKLESLSFMDLLSVLDISARFSCSTFIEQGLFFLVEKEIETIEECDAVLQYVPKAFQNFDNQDKYKSIQKKCTQFLSRKFFPLEFKVDLQNVFKNLQYDTILSLLQSNHSFALNETSLFVLLYRWLIYNPTWQTAEGIESFLDNIHYQSLTLSFLTDELTVCDRILNVWSGYSNWFATALKYHLLTPEGKELRDMKLDPVSITRTHITSEKCGLYVSKHLVCDDEKEIYCPVDPTNFVWNGVCFHPIVISTNSSLQLRLIRSPIEFTPENQVKHYHKTFKLYVCLLPGNRKFKLQMLRYKKFTNRRIRKIKVLFSTSNSGVCTVPVAIFDESYKEVMEEHGLQVTFFFKKSNVFGSSFNSVPKSTDKMIKFCGNHNDISGNK